MKFSFTSRLPGAQRAAGITGLAALAASGALWAQSVANVNGQEISADVFNLFLESRIQKPASEATPAERTTILEQLTDIYLLTTTPTSAEIAKAPRTKAQIELQMRGILAQAVATDFLTKNQATDEEILAAYNEQMTLAPALEFKARHILVETQSEALALITELEGGADFVELAKSSSTGPSGPNGGDLGWFAPNQMVAPFSQAVAELDDGAFTKAPVQTQFGWHVILREDSRQATPPTLESVRDVVKQRVEQEKLQNYLEDLRSSLQE